MLQVSLSAPHTARLTWLTVPVTQAVVPVFAKNTEKVPVSPELRLRNALSNWYAESYAVAARAVVSKKPSVMPSASAAAVTAVVIRRIRLSFRVLLNTGTFTVAQTRRKRPARFVSRSLPYLQRFRGVGVAPAPLKLRGRLA